MTQKLQNTTYNNIAQHLRDNPSTRRFAITMNDGKQYACDGSSIKTLAKLYNVPVDNINSQSTFGMPHITEYFKSQ